MERLTWNLKKSFPPPIVILPSLQDQVLLVTSYPYMGDRLAIVSV